jgi:pyridoxal phosphate enzyme (YggS family)
VEEELKAWGWEGWTLLEDRKREIATRIQEIQETLSPDVMLVAAVKDRTLFEVQAAIDAGVKHFGHNYVQEAVMMLEMLEDPVHWHMIGHLQRNKAKKAVLLFDMIETLDSWELAQDLDRYAGRAGKIIPVLVEINSGREASKTGVLPRDLDELTQRISGLEHLRVEGLMTMGPRFGDPEDSRPYFQETRKAFERLRSVELPNINMRYLSMGMSNSYRVAIEEGANVVRIGTKLFGPRSE